MTDIVPPEIESYILDHTSPEEPVLQQINRDTQANVLLPRMLSGHWQGVVLKLLSQMIRPRYALEIGTYTGYSALCLAEGLLPEGRLITLDINEELESRVRAHFAQSARGHLIDYRIGHAIEIIPHLPYTFDLVFIDADKINYLNYYNLVFDKVAPGGFILTDNVLWNGKVVSPAGAKTDKDTAAIQAFNDAVAKDIRAETTILPVRDGIMMTRKK